MPRAGSCGGLTRKERTVGFSWQGPLAPGTIGTMAAATDSAADRQTRLPVRLPVNVGMPKNVPWQGKTIYTAVWKHPVAGPVMARRLNLDGDGQGDRQGHGGEQRAVLVYQIQSYRHWEEHFG